MLAAMYGIDIAQLAVRINEGSLYPNLALTASASQDSNPEYNVNHQFLASVMGQLTIPIYHASSCPQLCATVARA